jgi:hypothetical protein
MSFPIATKGNGICFAFPDVCLTPAPPAPDVPVPYPNIGQLADADGVADNVLVNDEPVIIQDSTIPSTTGNEAGTTGGVTSGVTQGKVEFTTASTSVLINGVGVVRMFDSTTQNDGNAVGTVLGGVPTVIVGG